MMMHSLRILHSDVATIHLKLEIGKLDQECTLHG
jgi:hypothetical protein